MSKKKAPAGPKGTYTAAQQQQLAWLKAHYPFANTTASAATSRAKAKTATTKTSRAKTATAVKKTATKARSLSPGDVGCCTAEAVAAWWRLQGADFSDADMLALFWDAGAHPDRGIPIPEMLDAAGLIYEPADPDTPGDLILGVDLPGPHAVLATADGWWSWGEIHCSCEFPDALIDEAWVISGARPA